MSYDADNIFALILKKQVPACVVEETDTTLTFMDIMPKAPGHALVIPKESAENLFEISDSMLSNVIHQVKRVAKAAKIAYPEKGIRVVQLNGTEAGQTVFHIHFHIIPSDDGMNFGFHGSGSEEQASLEENAEKLRQALLQVS